jgi:CHRD domain
MFALSSATGRPVRYLTRGPADFTIDREPATKFWRSSMRPIWAVRLLAIAGVLALALTTATAEEGPTHFSTSMTGFEETPPILTNGSGTFRATVHGDAMTYTETFGGLTSPVTQSHIHFAERGVAGSIFVFLCSNLGNGPAGTQACPANGGTITGTVTAANVLAVGSQNITAGEFAELLRILRAGDGYVNVHTVRFPAGEIRGQLRGNNGEN